VINVAAHRISTMEIEAVVGSHPQVMEAAVVGVPDPTKGTVPIAFVTIREGEPDAVVKEIKQTVAVQLGGYAQLATVFVTAAMPKTRTGKIMRRLLRDIAVHGAPQGDTSAMEDPSALEVVTGVVAAIAH
jgi:acetyl-CoA synthetase